MNNLVSNLIQNWDNRLWWRQVAFPYLARTVHAKLPHSGMQVADEDWDNLVILDACRYDMFALQNTIKGELTKRHSMGSNTPEFLQANFADGEFRETVYVTANPQVKVHMGDKFFEIVNVWEDQWDETLNTVPPGVMVDETIAAYEEHPNKRLIAHFIQPHYPFIGEVGQKELEAHSGMELSRRLATGEEGHRDQKSIWEQLYERRVSTDIVWRAYRENLDLVLSHVEHLAEAFQERTVVTSDHGNALGERAWPVPVRIYGHPPEIRMPELIDVPWLVIEKTNRKDIVAEEPTQRDGQESEVVSERLADLGYK